MKGHWSHDPEAYRVEVVGTYSPRQKLAVFVLMPVVFWLGALLALALFK